MTQARKELEKAERAYENLGDAISSSEKKAKKANYDRLTKELREVRREAEKTKKEMEGLLSGGTTDKGPSLTDGIEGTTKGAWGTALTVLENDATQVLLNGFGNYIGAKLSSALTTDDATMVTSIASGAMTGALAGSIVPGVGHLVGAIVGGIAGAIGGALTAEAEKFKSEDEFFKEIVEEEFNSALGGIKESVANGRGIAKNRENSSFVFGNLLGSEEKGETFLRSLKPIQHKNTVFFRYPDRYGAFPD